MGSLEALFGKFYQGKRILVTGHTGFKGAWLCLWLSQLGASVSGYSLDIPTQKNLFTVLNFGPHFSDIRGDIRNQNGMSKVFEQVQPEIVFHLAAQSLVRVSYESPLETYETNVMGTANVLEAARKTSSVRGVVVVTSDKCYDNSDQGHAYQETDAMGGYDPYSSSKGCAELVTAAYRRSFGMHVASGRAGNVIGGGDWALDRLIPDCVRAFSSHEVLHIRYPLALRPWQYVLEPLSGYLLLGSKLQESKICTGWNFGPPLDEFATVETLVKKVKALWGHGTYRVESEGQPHEMQFLSLDTHKAHSELGWEPVYSVQKALEVTIAWYLDQGSDKTALSVSQLDQYVKMAQKKGLSWAC